MSKLYRRSDPRPPVRPPAPLPRHVPDSSAMKTPSKVVLIVIHKVCGPEDCVGRVLENIQVKDFFWVLSQFGELYRASMFMKDFKKQVLAHFVSTEAAQACYNYLKGKPVPLTVHAIGPDYRVECVLHMIPSSQRELTFKNKGDMNADFSVTNNAIRQLLSKQISSAEALELWRREGVQGGHYSFLWGRDYNDGWLVPRQADSFRGSIPPPDDSEAGQVGHCLFTRGWPADREQFPAAHLFRLISMCAGTVAVKFLYKRPGCAIVQLKDRENRDAAMRFLKAVGWFLGTQISVEESKSKNATNWQGASPELVINMCVNQPEVPVVAGQPRYLPSCYLHFWDVPFKGGASGKDAVMRLLGEVERASSVRNISVHGARDGVCEVVVEFNNRESAILVAAELHGQQFQLTFGSWMVKTRFLPSPQWKPARDTQTPVEQPPPPPPAEPHPEDIAPPQEFREFQRAHWQFSQPGYGEQAAPYGPQSHYFEQQCRYEQPSQGYYEEHVRQRDFSSLQPQGGYEQPPQGSYEQPPQGSYEQPPQQGGYEQPPQQGGYEQPPQGSYEQPPQGGYEQPPQGGYEQTPHGYAQQQQSGYVQTPQGSYELPHARYEQQAGYEQQQAGYDQLPRYGPPPRYERQQQGGYEQHQQGHYSLGYYEQPAPPMQLQAPETRPPPQPMVTDAYQVPSPPSAPQGCWPTDGYQFSGGSASPEPVASSAGSVGPGSDVDEPSPPAPPYDGKEIPAQPLHPRTPLHERPNQMSFSRSMSA